MGVAGTERKGAAIYSQSFDYAIAPQLLRIVPRLRPLHRPRVDPRGLVRDDVVELDGLCVGAREKKGMCRVCACA